MYTANYKKVRKLNVKNTKRSWKKYKNLHNIFNYFFQFSNFGETAVATNYLYRLGLFIRLCKFFKSLRFNYNMLLKIFYSRFYNIWELFINTGKRKLYYFIIKQTIILYKKLFLNSRILKTNTFITRPSHFLIDLPLAATGRNPLKNNTFNHFYYLKKNSKYQFKKLLSGLTINDFGDNFFTIHFIRTQRRYNKRRYSRVRAFSRPSFFAGISLSSMFIGSFWNGTIKNVDWLTAWPVVIDVNVVLFILFSYSIFRLYRVYYISIFVRKRGKIKIVSALNRIFLTKTLWNFF